MGIIFYTSVSIFLYSQIDSIFHKFEKKFFLATIVSTAIFYFTSMLIFNTNINDVDRGILVSLIFLITSFIPRIIFPKPSSEVQLSRFISNRLVKGIGIIDFTWISLMAFTICGILYFNRKIPLRPIMEIKHGDYSQKFIDLSFLMLDKTIDAFFVLGGALAVCMTILWAGEIWRQENPESTKIYQFSLTAAIKMVSAYFIIIYMTIRWFCMPIYDNIINIIELS